MKYHCVILSGGMDSATLLHHVAWLDEVQEYGSKVLALSFDYGQRHVKELEYAAAQAADCGVSHTIIPLGFLTALAPKSALTGDVAVPEGHYAADNMKLTVVPGRNTIFLALALAFVEGQLEEGDTATIYYGAHAGDHTIYPDCRLNFAVGMDLAIRTATEERIKLVVPYQHMDKGDILDEGRSLSVDYSKTMTCYAGTVPACGKCGSCSERLIGFDKARMTDPLEYADREYYKQNL
jgi:7-cyano-7-deazaguanine synthase